MYHHKIRNLKYSLVFVGVAALLNKMDRQDVTVAVDGSLYRFHPHFHDLMVEKIQQLVKPEIKVKMGVRETK